MKKFGKLGIVAIISVCVCMLVSVAASAANLKDIEKHWAKEYIEYGVEKGYISGYQDGTFLPDKTVTRAEFSKMINSAVKLTAVGTAKGDFSDVKSSDWYFNEVKKAENAGYITGYEDGSFRPSNSVTRQEAAVVLSRIVLPINERANINSFGDGDKIDTWATDAVTMIAAKGYIKGDEKGNFNPKGALTRSQAAKLICEFVRNENVVNKNQNITEAGKEIVYSEALFTDDIVIDVEGAQELSVVFKNCRVLGTIYVKNNDAEFDFTNTKVKALYVNAEDVEVNLDKTSEVKNADVLYPATLKGDSFKKVTLSGDELSSGTVKLEGTFSDVAVEADAFVAAETVKAMSVSKKVSLSLQSGTVETLNVAAAAKGATINLASKVVIEKAVNKAAVSYVGGGKIELADNEVTGVSFDGVTVEKQEGKKGDGDSVGSKTDDKFFDDVTVTPAKGKSNQAVSVNVQLTFIKNVLDKKGEKLTADYIKDNFELRKSTASGTKIAYEATVASTGKKITINPVANLTNGSTYYLVIPKGALTYDDGSENDKFETYFKTAAANDDEKDDEEDEEPADENAEVTFSPKSGAEDVSLDTTIKLTFSGTLKAYSSSDTFDADYIEDEAIKIYKESTSGDEVNFSASVSGKTVTLTPSKLLGETKYYVVILANKIKVGGSTLSKTTMSFTTEAGVPIAVSPANGDTGVSTMPEITVSFSEPMLQINGEDKLTEDYIVDDVVLFRLGSATTKKDEEQISFSVKEIAENGRKFVIVPDEELESGKTYYIVIQDETLFGETSETENKKVTSSFKTASAMAPMFYPTDGKETVSLGTEIKISFSDDLLTYSTKKNERVEVDDDYLAELVEKDIITFKRGSKALDFTATIDSDGRTIIITPEDALLEEKTYTVAIKTKAFYSVGGKSNSAGSASFSTNVAMSPTITPKNEAEGVALTVNPTIKFSEPVFNAEGKELKSLYLKNTAIKFVDENENDVDFTASIDGSTITVKPEDDLEGNMAYTLTLVAGTITNEDGLSNAEKSVTFTTKISYTIDITPETDDRKATSPLVKPTVKFGTKVMDLEGGSVNEEYAKQYIFLSQGKKVTDFEADEVVSAQIVPEDDGRTFTIVPDEQLEYNTTYYVNVLKDGFYYEDEETKNKATSISFKTVKEPELTGVKVGTPTSKSVKISFKSNVKGKVVVEGGAEKETKNVSASTSEQYITVDKLDAGTDYTLSVYLVYDDVIETEPVELEVTTKE